MASTGSSRWLTLTGLAIASCIGCIDFTIVNTIIPAIQTEFRSDVSRTQWVVTSFLLALSAFMVVAGSLSDLYGRRRLLNIGLVVFLISSLGAGLADSLEELIAFRFIQGTSVAILYTSSAAVVASAFPEQERGKAMGILFAGNGLGLALGPVAGGFLVDVFGWQSAFLINVPFLLASLLLCLVSVRESHGNDDKQTIDWSGLALLVPGLMFLLHGITSGPDNGWKAVQTWGTVAIGIVLLAFFARVEKAVKAPLLRLDLFANHQFVVASIATFSLAFFYCAAFFLMPQYMSIIKRYEPLWVGFALLPTSGLVVISSPIVGRLTDRYGTQPMLICGLALLAVSAGLQMLFSTETSLALILPAFAVMGIGWGCILGPATVAAVGSVNEASGARALGASWTIHNLGGAVGLALATVVYRVWAVGEMPLHQTFVAGYQASMALLAGVCLFALTIVFVIAWMCRTDTGGAVDCRAER